MHTVRRRTLNYYSNSTAREEKRFITHTQKFFVRTLTQILGEKEKEKKR